MFMTDQQSAKLPEPGVGSFYDPAALVAAEFASIFIPSFLVVLAIRGNQFDAPLSEPPTQRIGIVPGIGDYALRFLSRAAARLRDRDFGQRGFRKRNFCRRGTFQLNSQRNAFTVCQYHPLRSLAALGFPDRKAPFVAGAKLPSRNSHPSAAGRFHPAPPTGCARLPAKSLALASVAAAASRSRARETRPEEIATPLPSAESRECPPDRRGWLPVADRVYRLAASAGET